MSWYVLVDGNNILARSGIADPSLLIGSPEVKVELNKAGSFQFDIYPPHPYYDRLIKMKTKIDVVLNGEMIFSGRVLYTQMEMDKKRKVYCEGCLAYLLDSIQESYEYDSRVTQFYDMTVHEFLDRLLTRHDKMFVTDKLGVLDNFQGALTAIGISEGNTDTTARLKKALDYYNPLSLDRNVFNVDDNTKLFKLGTVNAEGTADRFKFEIKGHSKTLDMILETLVDSVGGFMQAHRDSDGWYVLDWKDKFGNENMQSIEWGTNLIELQQDESGVETFTRLYPVGKPSNNTETTGNGNITLRETRMYFPIPDEMIVYDDPRDPHEEGTEITNPKVSGFYELINGNYVPTTDTDEDLDFDNKKQYYMPIFGNPLMLKVDDILNYSQVYMGDFTALGVQMDALALNGNVDLSNRPRVSAADMRAAGYTEYEEDEYATLYSMSYGDDSRVILVTPIKQDGTVKTQEEIDEYAEGLLDGGFNTIKNRDTERLLIHVIEGPDTTSRQDSIDAIADRAHELSDEWETLVDVYFPNGSSPASMQYYEVQQYGYVLTEDTKPVRNKNYYTLRPEETRSNLEEKYGVIIRGVDFSDVNGINDEAKQQALYKKAVDYIQKTCTDLPEQITLTAIDLRNLDTTIEQMSIGRDIHIKSKPHGIDRHMKCISIDYYLDSPEKNAYVISSKPTGSDAIPRFTEQAETKKKSGSGGAKDSSGGTGGIGGGGSDPEQTEEEIAALKNHVFYTAGSDSDATMTGSYNQLFAKALGMLVDDQGNPVVDIDGNWAWDQVTDASTPRNSIITQLDIRPSSGTLISEINTVYELVTNPTGNPNQQGWYEHVDKPTEFRTTKDTEVVQDKDYYDTAHHKIVNPSSAVYKVVAPASTDDPYEKGWYEIQDNQYVMTNDRSVVTGKTYYSKKSPKDLNWQEPKNTGNYELTPDTQVVENKRYFVKNEGDGTTIASSRVEVHPSQVIINSLNNPTYHLVETPIPAGTNPRKSRWYVLVDGQYRRTDDETVTQGHTYYYLDTIAAGSVEVTPGDILIEAINQNGTSNVKIDASQITLKGNTTVDGILKIQDNALYVQGGDLVVTHADHGGSISAVTMATSGLNNGVTIGTGGKLRFTGVASGEYYDLTSSNVDDIIIGFGTPTTDSSTGTVSIPYATVGIPTMGGTEANPQKITFNRAATTTLSGEWGSGDNAGKFIVTASPQGTTYVLNPGLRLNGAGQSDFTAEITETVGSSTYARKTTPGYLALDGSGSSRTAKVYTSRSGSSESYVYSNPVASISAPEGGTRSVTSASITAATSNSATITFTYDDGNTGTVTVGFTGSVSFSNYGRSAQARFKGDGMSSAVTTATAAISVSRVVHDSTNGSNHGIKVQLNGGDRYVGSTSRAVSTSEYSSIPT